MRLKRIELAGFKSFVDATKIDLDPGITAIVGPNGCGKSNIVDALRWVLGEHSARHLRGGVMDDLIFQGSDSRAPVAICDVELTFTLEPGVLSAPYHQLHEIRVRRRLMRDGGSDAFINGKMVRIKDIVDLFLDTGISTRAYAIIEQGSIARMVTAKPEERRVIFEEAAGVMKYRSRRREAERRMKDTRLNLDRVLDLRDEVRSQCRSLKQQASRAERFKLLQDELIQLQSLSLALRYRGLQKDHQHMTQQLAAARRDEAEAAQQCTSCELAVTASRAKLVAHEEDAQGIQDDLRQAERQRADLQQQTERMAGERRLLIERKTMLHQRMQEAEANQLRLRNDQARIDQQLSDQDDSSLQHSLQQADAAVDAAASVYRAQSVQRDALLTEFERLRLNHEQAEQQRQNAEHALIRLEQRASALNQRRIDLHEQLNQRQQAVAAALAQQAAVQQQSQLAESALNEAQQQRDRCRDEREHSVQAFNQQEANLREWVGVAQELRGRSINQDVPDALREAMQAKGGLWMDADLHVPAGLEAAVAAALRGRSADVYMSEDIANDDLKALLEQASAAPVALFCGVKADVAAVQSSLAVALEMTVGHPLYEVFAAVRLVDDITNVEGKVCSVSRDGWRRESSGWLIPPSGNRTARRLAVQRKLREAEIQIEHAEAALKLSKMQFGQAEQALEQQQQIWQQAHQHATECDSESHAADAAVLRLKSEITAMQQDQQRLQSDEAALADERTHWQKQLAEASDVARLDGLQQQAENQLHRQDAVLSEAERLHHDTHQHKALADQALALFVQARDHLQGEAKRLQTDDLRLNQQIEADRDRLQRLDMKLEMEQNQSQQQLDQQLKLAIAGVDSAHQAMHAVRSSAQALQALQQQAQHSEQQARKMLQLIEAKCQDFEVRQAQYVVRLQDCEAEIQQRCQCTAATLLQDIAAMQADIDDNAPADKADTDDADVDRITRRANAIHERINRFGPVNLLAIDEFEQANERETFLAAQAADLEASLHTLSHTIGRIDRTTKQRFKAVFDQSNAYFKQTFPQLFGGGRAELRLDDDDILTAGVEVIAQPPGKRLQDMSLLSGGEKALTAVALVFSLFKIKPAPFCVLDEVDAPLDDANVVRFADMVRELSTEVQFLSISHNKITMQKADRLIGVSMPEAGVSKIVSVDLQLVPN
ncbi:MAG: chromosome segregation protein SMC [Mariprofundus sp.]|nr:chromosome segregation protein SMC [Mariprofundus sp.]